MRVTGPLVANHVGLCVADLDRSIRFYVELLGFEVEREVVVGDGVAGPLLAVEAPVGLRAVYLRAGSFVLELLHFDRLGNPPAAARVFNEPGLTHLSVCVDDPAQLAEQVERFGGSVVTSLLPMALIIKDPDGQLLELLPMSYRQG